MLPRSLRLTRRGFEESRGLRRAHSPHFSISYGYSETAAGSAVIVPKKVVKGAVTRHLMKRRIRAILRPYSSSNRILIVSAKAGADALPYAEIEKEISSVLDSIVK